MRHHPIMLAAACAGFLTVGGTAGMAQAQSGATALEACERYPTEQASYACVCASDAASGSVWGSDPYTSDSNICVAALHAGAIGPQGGAVSLELVPGQQSYVGTEANGITTSNWGSYGSSFTFVKSSGSVCDGVPDDTDAFTCTCDPADGFGGSVWGSGPYTADSDICTAAIHFGVIDETGGTVNVLALGGLDTYSGSDWYGVVSRNWGSYPRSFTFDLNR